jgi:hypothetical protein
VQPNLKTGASLVRAESTTPLRRLPALGVVEPPAAGLKARQLFDEARVVSLEHLGALQAAIAAVRGLSDEIVDGGELYVPGLRELARKLTEDLFWTSKTLELLSRRQGEPRRGAGARQLSGRVE